MFDLTTDKDLLQQAVAAAERNGDWLALAETQWSLAQIIVYTFDMEAAYVHAQPALALARELNQPDLLARSLNTLAFIEGCFWQRLVFRFNPSRGSHLQRTAP